MRHINKTRAQVELKKEKKENMILLLQKRYVLCIQFYGN